MKRNLHEKGNPSYHLVAFMWAHEKEIVQNLQQPPEGTFHIMYREHIASNPMYRDFLKCPKPNLLRISILWLLIIMTKI